jgi:hypothetical protein
MSIGPLQIVQMRKCTARSTWSLGDAAAEIETEDALAGDWGRTNEEPCLRPPDYGDRFSLRCGGSHLHKNDSGSHGGNRCSRVHHDAQLAVVSVSGAGVEVSDLGEGKGGQQDEAQACDNRQQIAPAAELPAENRLNCLQIPTSTFLFYRRTQFV